MKTVIALDVGHSAVKVVVDSPAGRQSIIFPSVATPAIDLSETRAREAATRETVIIDNLPYFFGETAVTQGLTDSETGLSEGWISSAAYSALILGAFLKLEQLPNPIRTDGAILVVGLPAAYFRHQKDELKSIMQRLAPNAAAKILPQPFGPFMCIQFDNKGVESKSHQMSDEAWGIIEIGHFTTDIGVVRSGHWIERHADSCSGAHVLVQRVVERIQAERGYTIPLVAATKAIVDGTFKDRGEVVSVKPFVDESVVHLATQVMDTLSRKIDRDARSLDGIVVAGGAAGLLFPLIKARYPHAVMAENSRMTVAEGFCRFGMAYRNDMRIKAEREARSAANSSATAA